MRTPLFVAAVLGFLGVALGAFGAHGVEGWLKALPPDQALVADAAKRMGWWHTAVQYHLVHALLAVALAMVSTTGESRAPLGVWLCAGGVVLFSGSLYTMTLTGITKLGMVTPLGGLAFLAAWVVLILESLRKG